MRRLLIAVLFVGVIALQLGAGEDKPPAPRPPPVVSPEILADHSVVFRIKAAQAKEVSVRGQWAKDPLALTRDEHGVWSATAATIPAGVWEYSLVVDGVTMIDTGNAAIKPMREPRTSILHLAATPAQPWDLQDHPHGSLHTHLYQSKALGAPRELMVYTPPGYERGTATYPLLVLQHGSGDNQQTWTAHGKANLILDHLIAAGRAQPMVVVMLSGHHPARVMTETEPAKRRAQAQAAFRDELLLDALPLLDAIYRVDREPARRAIAGLSMGGGQSLGVGLAHSDRFGWVGAFSAAPPDLDLIQATLGDAAGTNAKLKLLWIACGKDDFLRVRNETFITVLKEKGIQHEWVLSEGGHSWPVWRQYLVDFLPRLFVVTP